MKSLNKIQTGRTTLGRISLALLLFCSLSIVLSSCGDKHDDDETSPVMVTDKGIVQLHLHTWLGNDAQYEVQIANNPIPMANGRLVGFSIADMYVSDIQLVKLDGSVYSFSGKRVLKVLNNELYLVGEAPVGNYSTIRFKIGLDPATNALNPASSADSAILNKPGMWFGSTAQPEGYVFLHAMGLVDTSANLSGSLVPFDYKIGTNAHYIQASVAGINHTVVKGQAEAIHVIADYSTIFNAIDLTKSSNLSITTTAENNFALATTIANIIATQLFIKEP